MPKLVKKPIEQLGKVALVILSLGSLSACVTQNFAEEKPVVERDYSDTQIARTRISLALGYLQMGNMTQAKYNLEKAKQFSPDLPDVYTAFAHYYETVGEFEQTEEAYLQALSLADDNADTLNNFGVFLCRQGRVDEAETHFMRAIEVP
ncbi:MAG: tetratricopeptide repeat protein, partial [Thalassotalea sp.]|nr:tetratricopeptide repeat protein [Thalassotalea sp.]